METKIVELAQKFQQSVYNDCLGDAVSSIVTSEDFRLWLALFLWFILQADEPRL